MFYIVLNKIGKKQNKTKQKIEMLFFAFLEQNN